MGAEYETSKNRCQFRHEMLNKDLAQTDRDGKKIYEYGCEVFDKEKMAMGCEFPDTSTLHCPVAEHYYYQETSLREVANSFEAFVKRSTPNYVDYNLRIDGGHDPVKVDIDNEYIRRTEKVLIDVYGGQVQRRNVGGGNSLHWGRQNNPGGRHSLCPPC